MTTVTVDDKQVTTPFSIGSTIWLIREYQGSWVLWGYTYEVQEIIVRFGKDGTRLAYQGLTLPDRKGVWEVPAEAPIFTSAEEAQIECDKRNQRQNGLG